MVFLTHHFRPLLKHNLAYSDWYFCEEASDLAPQSSIIFCTQNQTAVVGVCEVTQRSAQPLSVLSFVFLEKVVLGSNQHYVDGRQRNFMIVFMT